MMNTPPAPLTDYSGFELALGSVFAVRWFAPDQYGRLHAINHRFMWKPGENVAKCQRDEGSWFPPPVRMTFRAYADDGTTIVDTDVPLAAQAVEARVKVEHIVPMDSCGCGFYAFAQGCDDGQYVNERTVRGVIECYGRTILGTRGLRCERARIVALTTDRADVRRAYSDVKCFDPPRDRRFRRRKPTHAAMLKAFDLVQPHMPNPDDPDFWERP